MPGFIAKKLCPELVIVNPNYDKYHTASDQVQRVLSQYDPNFCPAGLDESYLDITNHVKTKIDSGTGNRTQPFMPQNSDSSCSENQHFHLWESEELPPLFALPKSHWLCAERVVQDMREDICRITGLTASAGIAPNKMLAKIASDMNKPNGQFLVEPTREGVLKFMEELPIRKVI